MWATMGRLLPALITSGAVLAAMTWVTRSLHPLLASPLELGPAGIVYLVVAARTGNSTAISLLARTRSVLPGGR